MSQACTPGVVLLPGIFQPSSLSWIFTRAELQCRDWSRAGVGSHLRRMAAFITRIIQVKSGMFSLRRIHHFYVAKHSFPPTQHCICLSCSIPSDRSTKPERSTRMEIVSSPNQKSGLTNFIMTYLTNLNPECCAWLVQKWPSSSGWML